MQLQSPIGDRWAEEYHLASRNLVLSTHIPPPPSTELPDLDPISTDPPEGTFFLDRLEKFGASDFDRVLLDRRSCWQFSSAPLSQRQLGRLLYLSVGVQSDRGSLVPSAGGLRSTRIYPLILSDGDVPMGLYRYEAELNQIRPQSLGCFRDWFRRRVLLQPELANAPLALILVCDLYRLRARYPNRAYRLALLDCGHVSQNLYLVATQMGLGCLSLSGYVDDEINEGLELDGLDQACLLITVVGQKQIFSSDQELESIDGEVKSNG